MGPFDVLYQQTVTLFNRIKDADGETFWYPTVLEGVHLIDTHSSSWNNQGGASGSTAELRVLYVVKGGQIIVANKPYYEPKAYRRLVEPEKAITFAYGHDDNADFFIEGVHGFKGAISDDAYDRHGFYNYMKKSYDGVYSISGANKFNLLPHFVISAR